jgi:hypothetical protein
MEGEMFGQVADGLAGCVDYVRQSSTRVTPPTPSPIARRRRQTTRYKSMCNSNRYHTLTVLPALASMMNLMARLIPPGPLLLGLHPRQPHSVILEVDDCTASRLLIYFRQVNHHPITFFH